MLKHLTTEARNPASEVIDTLTPLEIVRLMNAEDALVAPAVAAQAEQIAAAIDVIAKRFQQGGRLIYLGAGTSGRLGVLDATECPPTFNSPPGQVIGLIAGGPTALTQAVEGAEDRPELAVQDLQGIGLSASDVVVGIATSGRTPYVVGGLQYARQQNAATIALSCNAQSVIAQHADLAITPIVGPEVVSGSTRLKAGTATKMVLNMLTTGAMIRIGKTYGNLMVDLRATNSKLRDRTVRIVAHLTGQSEVQATELLGGCDGELKTAVVLHALRDAMPAGQGTGPALAHRLLTETGGHLREAVEKARTLTPRTALRSIECGSLLLGIDGGGTGTLALLATRRDSGELAILGRGACGPSNPQVVGFPVALRVIDEAISRAFAAADLVREKVDAVCLALAGAGRDSDLARLQEWAACRGLAKRFLPVHDALPVLAAGTPDVCGVALIAGTGSLCFGRDAMGRTARAGGWGYLLGDEGSGYWMAMAGLRAVVAAADGRGPPTILTHRLLEALGIETTQHLVPTVYAASVDRARLASLAPAVLEAAMSGDAAAGQIVEAAGRELAAMITAVVGQLEFSPSGVPLALGGSLLIESPLLRERLSQELAQRGITADPVQLVSEPALGALKLAESQLTG